MPNAMPIPRVEPAVVATVTFPEPLSVSVTPPPATRLSRLCDPLLTVLVCNKRGEPPPDDAKVIPPVPLSVIVMFVPAIRLRRDCEPLFVPFVCRARAPATAGGLKKQSAPVDVTHLIKPEALSAQVR